MKRNRVLDELRETSRGLARIGAFGKQTMKQFDAFAIAPVVDLSPKQIRALRERNRVSQAVFAAMLNTSISTVQKWEIGQKRPSGPSLKLLNMIQRNGLQTIG